MAVLTEVTEDDVRKLLSAYALGGFRALQGIAGGSVNSNFGLETERDRFFLRLYEERDHEGAQRETAMLDRLAGLGVLTPAPLRRLDGGFVSVVKTKPAAIFPWRDGQMRCQASVSPGDARRVGEALAHVHLAGAAEACDAGRFRFADLNRRLDGVEASADPRFVSVTPRLRAKMAEIHSRRDVSLPGGLVHGDLFRDNVVWDKQGKIAALLDFESACAGTYAYDLMVTVLAWCVGDELESSLATAMRDGYENVRALSGKERRALRTEGCFAALRFTVTRITDYAMRPAGPGPRVIKDWERFMKRFEMLEAMGEEGVARSLSL